MNDLSSIQSNLCHTTGVRKKIREELDLVLEQEETLWFQKSQEQWLELGDHNTGFFHASTIIRRKHNRVEGLFDNEGNWVDNKEDMENLATEFFSNLYSASISSVDSNSNLGGVFPHLDSSEWDELCKRVSMDEI